jgi:hypothetical protein
MNQEDIDEVLGITRCAHCGHRLEGETECPFCSLFPSKTKKAGLPKWTFLTACFLTSPLSIYAAMTTKQLNVFEKMFALSGCLFWVGLGHLFF